MALVLADRVRETTTVTGTGTATLLGAAPGYQSFSAVGNANTTYYVIANQSATEWEVGIGTYTASGTLLSRDTVLSSSNSGSLVNFSAGTKDVFVDYPAGRAVYEDAAGNVDGYPITGGTINNTTVGATTPSTGVFTTLTGNSTSQFGRSSANYLQATGGDTTKAVEFKALGSDTNISEVFQSKGTGAIDLAAGSKGVNISNGGTVTAITITSQGSNYTSIPTTAIDAPTTAGGVQATFSVGMYVSTWTVTNGGTGYTVGDLITAASGGTYSTPWTLLVTAVSGGVITAISTGTGSNAGTYTVLPSGAQSVTGGTGSSATITINTWGVRSGTASITNAGSGYVEQPTVTFSGGGGSGAAAYATVGSIPTVKSIGSAISFSTVGGEQVRIVDSNSAATNYVALGGGTGAVSIFAEGSATNISETFSSKGTGSLTFQTNRFAQTQLLVTHTASAVNYVQVTGNATGSRPVVSSQGSDANIGLNFASKGNRSISFLTNSVTAFDVLSPASSVNYFTANGSITGFGPVLSATGSDTNIPLVLQPKGTGALQAQQTDSTATGGNARGANAVDWQTSRSTAAQVASGTQSFIGAGTRNTSSNFYTGVVAGYTNTASGFSSFIGSGNQHITSGTYSSITSGFSNVASNTYTSVVNGNSNTAAGYYNFIGNGQLNSGTSGSAVTTQSATMNGTTAVTLAASNASIKVGQIISGTSINEDTYVAAISGTSLTLSKVASGSSTSTLSFYTPHGVVVGGGNNQATGSYSFIGGGGDAGTAANRNVASGDWSVVGGGTKNVASGQGAVIAGGGYEFGSSFGNTASGSSSFVGGGILNTSTNSGSTISGGWQNIANGLLSTVVGGRHGNTRGITGNIAFPACSVPVVDDLGVSQAALLVLGRQTTDATATRLTSDSGSASTINQVIMPNNTAYFFTGEIISGVTGGGNTKGWTIEGVIKRGANAASTALVGTPTVTSMYADVGAATWAIAVTADTTNGGLAVTFTGQASTTIRTVAQIRTTEMKF